MVKFMPRDVLAVMGVLDAHLLWRASQEPPRGYERYHPSAFGKCLRLMQYQRYSERGYIPAASEEVPPHLARIFDNGHYMHDRWKTYFEQIGILRGVWQCTNPLCGATDDRGVLDSRIGVADLIAEPKKWLEKRRFYGQDVLQGVFQPTQCVCGWKRFKYHEVAVVSEEMNFAGHADIILDFSRFDYEKYKSVLPLGIIDDIPQKPVVVDMKTINHFDFQDVAKGNAHSYYAVQLMIYANVLECECGILIYENKNNQRTVAFKVDPSSDHLFPQIYRQAREMNEMVDVVDAEGNIHHKLPPPRPGSKGEKECQYCIYRELCHSSEGWDDPELDAVRRDFYGDLSYDH